MYLPSGAERPTYDQPLPAWVTKLRAPQVDAVRDIMDAFEDVEVVFLEAPVGSGKTLIAELVRREMAARQTMYICSDKALQDQFTRDYPYAKVLKGRSNYRTVYGTGQITCDDCTAVGMTSRCKWCPSKGECPYQIAKSEARTSELAVLNTAMALTLWNHTDDFRGNDLVIADECDLLEGALTGFIEFEVPTWLGELIGLEYPKKAVRKPTLVNWFGEVADAIEQFTDRGGMENLEPKKVRSVNAFIEECVRVVTMIKRDIDSKNDDDESGRWIRDYDTKTLKLRPVTVTHYGTSKLWRYGTKWLCMSGTILSADEMADSLGLPLDYRTVTVPSTFPIENRPVIVAPIANPIRSLGEVEWDKLATAVTAICHEHEGRVLVHCVSYRMAKYLSDEVRVGAGRRKCTYGTSYGKHAALDEYLRHPGGVMFAASMSRGVDLVGDKCAVQVICKVPFPSLGDKQVSSRKRMPGGDQWYAIQAIRDLVQMTGRGVRSDVDKCVTYVLDEQFVRMWRQYGYLMPKYFTEALDSRRDIRWLMKGRVA